MCLLTASLLVLAILKGSSCKQQYALNVPRILLPHVPISGIRSNFTLTSTHGCFTWSSTKPDVASVDAILEPNGKEGCSRTAIVTAQSVQPIRLSSIIVAEEVGGGIMLRCDVFVDTISRIEITTRTRELLLEEEPERFELQAYDDEGNMFSTLNGHILDWILLPDEETTHQQAEPDDILNFINFEESTYSTDPAIRRLEAEGLQGYTVLVSGVSTGSAKVQVSLLDKVWKEVQPSLVRLLVIENLMLQPCADVYILPLSFSDYYVERRKHGRSEIVPLPSDQYSLHLSNETVAELDTQKSRVTGLVLGYTEVVLHDKNMLHTPTASKPTAGIHVVPPHHLAFSIAPDNVWIMQTGREYRISVHLFDKNNHKIVMTGNIPISTILPLDFLTVHFSSMNGTYHHVTAHQRGSTHLLSTLSAVKHPITGDLYELPNSVSKKQLFEVYDPVLVEPKHLVLLWDYDSQFRYRHTLQASGGSGTYIWSCDPEGVVNVAANGTLVTVDKGTVLVRAADVKNTVHFDQAQVYVVPPAKMAFLPSRVEAIVGQSISLPLQVMGQMNGVDSNPMPFTDCRNLNIHIAMSDPHIFNISKGMEDKSLPEGSCMVFTAVAVTAGHVRLVVSYSSGRDVKMEAVVTIAAYLPLVPVDPETIAVVTLGSYKRFVFEGGPSPWVLDRSKFFKKMFGEEDKQVRVDPSDTPGVGVTQHVYHVTCLGLGEQVLSITVGNDPTLKNKFPATEEATARISCALPVSMTMHPVLSHMPDCPLYKEDSNQILQFPVLSGGNLDLEVELFDAESRPFDNFTSLQFLWESSDENLLIIPHPSSIDHYGKHAMVTVSLGDQTGKVVVTVTCSRHIQSFLEKENIVFMDPFSPEVKLSVTLLLRYKPTLLPSSILLYNHPGNRAVISILDGSRHFRIDTMTKYLPAEVTYSSNKQDIALSPFSEGKMKISVRDLCLDVKEVATVGVVVGGVYKIELMVSDVVQVGNSTLACAQVLDSEEDPYSAPQLEHYMNLRPHSKSSHISIYPITRGVLPTPPTHSICYIVEGVSVGSAYLLFNVTTAEGRLISSKPKEIQVFDPLSLQPKTITLLPTGTFQIQSSGGPKPQTSVLYSVSNVMVASVNDSGLIYASVPGTAVVTGKVRVHDPSSDQPLTYSQDVVNVIVTKLTGVKIFIATPRLLSGVNVAIYARGLNGESPFMFASSLPGLLFQWSVTNMDALSLSSLYDKAGVSLQEEQDFNAILHTRNPGQGTIRLIVKCPPGLCAPDMATFTDHIEVQVLPPLELLRPLSGHFLLPLNGLARIVTNRDGISRLCYQLLQGSEREKTNLVTVSKQGEVRAAGVNGHAVVMVTESEVIFGLNQTLIVHVEVRSIASLSIVPLSLAQATPNSKYHAYPLGYSAEFIAHLHDSVGRKFDYANIPLSHRLNRFDIALASPESGNTTYLIKATKQGHVILRIWLTSFPHIEDYVRIRVGYAIIPSLAVVHLGSTVCFSTHLTEDKPGLWSVGEEGVMDILPNSGVGQAVGVGRTVVYHKVRGVIDTHTELTVAKVHRVVFNVTRDDQKVFTNHDGGGGLDRYKVPVDFMLANGEHFTLVHTSPNKECLVGGDHAPSPPHGGVYYIQQVPFECQLELTDRTRTTVPAADSIEARAIFNPYTGESYCELLPVDISTASMAGQDGLRLSLKVVAYDLSMTYSVFSDILDVPFVPAIHFGRREVLLSTMESSTELTVTGLHQQLQTLKVTCPYPLSAVKVSSPSLTTAVYRVSFLPSYHSPPEPSFTNLNITFLLPLTQQEEMITVTFLESGPSDCLATPTLLPTDTPIRSMPGDMMTYLSPYYFYVIVPLVAMVMATIVICLALNKSSNDSKSGFSNHLPPSGGPGGTPQNTFSPLNSPPLPPHNLHNTPGLHTTHPSSFNVSQHGRSIATSPPLRGGAGGITPPIHGAGGTTPPPIHGAGGFNRTGFSSSPRQHGLFSQ